MAKTYSSMLPLGTSLPYFSLQDTTSGEIFDSKEKLEQSRICVVFFICNHCPYVIHIRDQITAIAKIYIEKGVAFVAISSNDPQSYPEDGPEAMATWAKSVKLPFAYLFDETQEVARAFHAACTPETYIFENNLLVYRGQFDDSRPSNGLAVTGKDVKDALDRLLINQKPSELQIPSVGCNIKWKTL